MAAALPRSLTTRAVRLKHHWVDRLAHFLIALIAILLVAFLAGPLLAILLQALEGQDGKFVGLANFIAYARTPALLESLWNSLWVSAMVTAITIPLAFGFAYALARSCMPFKPLFRGITLVPLLWILLTSIKSPPDSISYPPKVVFEPSIEGYCNLFTTRSRQTEEYIKSLPPADSACEAIARKNSMVVVSRSNYLPRFANSLIIALVAGAAISILFSLTGRP